MKSFSPFLRQSPIEQDRPSLLGWFIGRDILFYHDREYMGQMCWKKLPVDSFISQHLVPVTSDNLDIFDLKKEELSMAGIGKYQMNPLVGKNSLRGLIRLLSTP